MSRAMLRVTAGLAALLGGTLLAACPVYGVPVPYYGVALPCDGDVDCHERGAGWYCDPKTSHCVPGAEPDGGTDAGPSDAQ